MLAQAGRLLRMLAPQERGPRGFPDNEDARADNDSIVRKNKGNSNRIPKGRGRPSTRGCTQGRLDTKLRSTGQGGRDERFAGREVLKAIESLVKLVHTKKQSPQDAIIHKPGIFYHLFVGLELFVVAKSSPFTLSFGLKIRRKRRLLLYVC
jgi:hypothetical protein